MPTRPNVLFLLSDEHSFRAMSQVDPSRDGEPVATPHLDALAARACTFERTYCQVPLCTPSRICMLTGRDPRGNGGWDNGSAIRAGTPTLGSLFTNAGYDTCLVGKMHLGGNRQFAGFQHRPYGDLTGRGGHQTDPLTKPHAGMGMRSRTADAGLTDIPESILQEQVVTRESIAWLREQRHQAPDQPWMLCASFSRPHFPLTAPRRWLDRYWPDAVTPPKVGRTGDSADHPMTRGMARGFQTDAISHDEMMKARAAYFACVSYLDEILGDLLDTLERDGLLENTVIVYTSDHGELMGEHGMWWKNSWHEGAARVPWIVQLPEHRAGQLQHTAVNTPVSLADLLPTLCGLCRIEAPIGLDGTDLSPACRGGGEPKRGPVLFTNPQPRWGEGTEHIVVVRGRWKLVRFRSVAPNLLFDLDADPLEQRNLIASDEPEHRRVAAELLAVAMTWDFDAAETVRHADAAAAAAMPQMPRSIGGNNQYLLPNGRIVDADTPLYAPHVVAERAADVIADMP